MYKNMDVFDVNLEFNLQTQISIG